MLCPICKKPVNEAENRPATFPFCSQRCKLIDLGRWLGDKYQIPVDNPEDQSRPVEMDHRTQEDL